MFHVSIVELVNIYRDMRYVLRASKERKRQGVIICQMFFLKHAPQKRVEFNVKMEKNITWTYPHVFVDNLEVA